MSVGSLHWLARAAGRGHFLGASTSRRTISFCFNPFTSQNHDPKKWTPHSPRNDCARYVFQREFNAPPGAGRALLRIILKLWLYVVSEFIPNGKFVQHCCGVVSQLIRNMQMVWCSDSRRTGKRPWESWSTAGFNYRTQKQLSRDVFGNVLPKTIRSGIR